MQCPHCQTDNPKEITTPTYGASYECSSCKLIWANTGEDNPIIHFRGENIYAIEVNVIKEIEKITGELPFVDKIIFNIFGLTYANNSITGLGLHNTELASLPANIGDLSNLRELYISCNKLTSLPNSLGNLSNLESLDLQNNELTSLPKSIPAYFLNEDGDFIPYPQKI